MKEYTKTELGQAVQNKTFYATSSTSSSIVLVLNVFGLGSTCPQGCGGQRSTVFFTVTTHIGDVYLGSNLWRNHNPYEKLGAGSCSCCSCLSIAVRCLSSACLPSHCTGNLQQDLLNGLHLADIRLKATALHASPKRQACTHVQPMFLSTRWLKLLCDKRAGSWCMCKQHFNPCLTAHCIWH